MQEEAVTATVDWLVQAALAGQSESDLVQGVCERFVDAGAEQGPVAEPRQRVVVGLVAELLLESRQLGERLLELAVLEGDRGLLLKSALVYCVIAPPLAIGFFALITHGYIFVLFGLAAFIYMQFLLIRRLQRHLNETLPSQPAGDATAHAPTSSVSTAMSMPAI